MNFYVLNFKLLLIVQLIQDNVYPTNINEFMYINIK